MAASEGNRKGVTREGTNLLGSPTFTELANGRFRCVETGQEVVAGDKESYSQSKRCRLGLIDHALSQNKPPLNMFTQHPLYRSKLVCKLTGDTVNKSEEHIWKHVNGKGFLNKFEQTEMGRKMAKIDGKKRRGDAKPGEINEKGKEVVEIISEVRHKNDSDSEEPDFWVPPGRDRSTSGSKSSQYSDEGDIREISERTKRMSIEIGPSSFASRKKKSRKNTS